jgi:5'-nucleotidase
MAYDLQDKLVVAIASTALFDLAEADGIYRQKGLEAYRKHQKDNEDKKLEPGTGFPLVKGLLSINEMARTKLVEVVLMSRNDADSGYRILNSIEQWGIAVERAAFTDGTPVTDYLESFSCNLYLTTRRDEVMKAIQNRFPAALVYPPPPSMDLAPNPVRIAFDGDAVIFSDEADRVFKRDGLAGFQQSEAKLEDVPLKPGPLHGFLTGLSRIQKAFPDDDKCPLRTALVTARSIPAHKRPIKTLRSWNIRLDESFFLGGVQKSRVLAALKPHIFFDDQKANLDPAQGVVPVAEVPADLDTSGVGM